MWNQSSAHLAEDVCIKARNILARGRIPQDIASNWLHRASGVLRHISQELNTPGTKIGIKRKLQAKLNLLTTLKEQVRIAGTSVIVFQGQQATHEPAVRWDEVESAFTSRICTGVVSNILHTVILEFLEDARQLVIDKIKHALDNVNAIKVNAVLTCNYVKMGEEEPSPKTFNSANSPIFQTTDLSAWFENGVQEPLLKDLDEFEKRGSGWTLHSIINLAINAGKYNPMRGSSYIDLPQRIKDRRACINVKNEDQECFRWAILSALHPVNQHADRLQHYEAYKDTLHFNGLEFPIKAGDVKKFEKQNDPISVHVFTLGLKKGRFTVYPCYVSKMEKRDHVNLLLVQNYYIDEDAEYEAKQNIPDTPIQYHYVWIKHFSRLMHAQSSQTDHKHHFCYSCLHHFRTEAKLANHKLDCRIIHREGRTRLPTTIPRKDGSCDAILKFKNHKNAERVPFIVYADFECLLIPVEDQPQNTQVVQRHEPYSVGYYVHCSYDSTLCRYNAYRGQNPAKWFADQLVQLSALVAEKYANPQPMHLNAEEECSFQNADICHICRKKFNLEDIKVRNHNHLTGAFRGAAHQDCNLNYKDSRTLPIFLHNMTNYDGHILIRDVANCVEGTISILPENMEKYISITKFVKRTAINLRFLDSFRFMASSLEKLASYLPEYPITRQQMAHLSDEQFSLITKKGVFPYDYLDSWEKLEETSLPSKADFKSQLTGDGITDSAYEHAKRVWDEFNIKDLGEYSDRYLMTDVLLLADIFENFRNICLKVYSLDAANYFTAPGLGFDAALKTTDVQLELIDEIDKHLFLERGIRGGLSQCSLRYSAANNKYMGESFKPDSPHHYLMYYDVNNLYGWAMTQSLPYGGFEWIPEKDLVKVEWDVEEGCETGYFLEVDLDYPPHLHDLHSDLPFCPELSNPPGSRQSKLLATLLPKKRYIIHYRALRQALQHGIQLTKIHRILKFKQKPWLKPYIELNTTLRQSASNEFEKNFYKLMNNCVFGKTMECVRNRKKVKLVTHWEGRYGAEAYIAQPIFHSCKIFDENLVAIQLQNTDILLNKPIFVGCAVLDLSKTCVYNFHYDVMYKIIEPKNISLMYTDTDSFIYDITNVDIYDVMKANLEYFDTSDYSENNQFGMPRVNKKVVGLVKDEANGKIVTEFVGLRSKMYSVRIEGEDVLKKCKGVKYSVVKNTITFNDYKRCVDEKLLIRRRQRGFQSRKHVVVTIQQTKLALSPFDDKRYLIPNVVYKTLPWGHKDIPNDGDVEGDVEMI